MAQLPDFVKVRYLWLPVKTSKLDRHALEAALPAALTFLSKHLQQGRQVLVHCVEGDSTVIWLELPLVYSGHPSCSLKSQLIACAR